jgi:hypothetical protein
MSGPIHSAAEWGRVLRAPLTPVGQFRYIVVHHEGDGDGQGDWRTIMRRLQAAAFNHVEPGAPNGHSAIDYSFGAGLPGWKAEGRGWHARGAHTGQRVPAGSPLAGAELNVVGCGIVVPGNLSVVPVTGLVLDAIAEIIAEGVRIGAVAPDFIVTDHRRVWGTNCPGDHMDPLLGEIDRRARALLNQAPPAPPKRRALVTTIALPNSTPGRVGTARPIPELNLVLCENGGRLVGDHPTGRNHFWAPNDALVRSLPPGSLLDIVDLRPLGVPRIAALYDFHNGDVGTYLADIP